MNTRDNINVTQQLYTYLKYMYIMYINIETNHIHFSISSIHVNKNNLDFYLNKFVEFVPVLLNQHHQKNL